MNPNAKIVTIVASIVAACLVIGSVVLLAVMYEPWPVSTRQGPDTYYALDAFQRHFREVNPTSVDEVYAREESSFGGNTVDTFRFRLDADLARQQAVIDAIVAANSLTPLTPGEASGARVLPAPDWFPGAEKLHSFPEVWGRGNIFLWVDRPQENDEDPEATQDPPEDRATAYFQQANF